MEGRFLCAMTWNILHSGKLSEESCDNEGWLCDNGRFLEKRSTYTVGSTKTNGSDIMKELTKESDDVKKSTKENDNKDIETVEVSEESIVVGEVRSKAIVISEVDEEFVVDK